jgi:predicted P-loop ATPase
MKILIKHISRAIQVRYDDVGRIDGILIDIWGNEGNKLAKVFSRVIILLIIM